MAFTLAYHIILVPLGVALPTYTLLMEGIALRKKDATALKLARRWSVVMAVQFAVGAVTGTVLSFEFGILWPKMLGRFGAAFGLGFAIEGLAFSLDREVVMSELDDLVAAEVINIRANVGDDLRCNVLMMLLRIGDPLVRRICLPISVAKQQDRPSRGKGLADLPPVVRIPGFIRPLGIAGLVGNLMGMTL
jgi:hypothetical protein